MEAFLSRKSLLFLSLLAVCFPLSPAFAQSAKRVQVASNRMGVMAVLSQDVSVSLSVQPSTIRPGQQAIAQIRLRNPRQNEVFSLVATATYTDESGAERYVQSNEVQITVDVSLAVRVQVPAERITFVADSATFDGVRLTPAGNTGIAFDVVLPGDGQEHVLQFSFRRRQ